MGAEHTPLLVSNRGLSDFCAFGRPTSDEKIQMKWVHISSSAGTPRAESGVLDIVTATVRGGIDYITRLNLAGQTGHRHVLVRRSREMEVRMDCDLVSIIIIPWR